MDREIKDQALFDTIADQYAQKDIVPSSAIARQGQLLAALQPLLNQSTHLGTIIDIGCGVGAPAQYLQGLYERYIGIDQSAEMIEAACIFNQTRTGTEFLASNIKTVTLPDHTADVILSVGALHHMSELDEVMECLVRLAKPGATLVVLEPQNGNPVIQGMRWLRGAIDQAYSDEQIFFSEEELNDLFTRHGIIDLNKTFQGFLAPPFAEVILPPQFITRHLSRLAILGDFWLQTYLPAALQKLSFNIIFTGIFPK
jgi:SAM-dependent methyltransferase